MMVRIIGHCTRRSIRHEGDEANNVCFVVTFLCSARMVEKGSKTFQGQRDEGENKMTSNFWNSLIFLFVCGSWATSALVVGLRGIILRRPLLVSARSFFLVMFVPSFVLIQSISEHWWTAAVYAFAIIIPIFFPAPYYYAFGVTDGSMRKGLLASLTILNLPYEETSNGLRLTTMGAEVTLKQFWASVLGIKPRRFLSVLSDIAKCMNRYYRTDTAVEVNRKEFIVYLVLGGILALVAFWFGLRPLL